MLDAMIFEEPRHEVRSSLSPGDHELTEELVFRSGLARLRDISAVANRLLLDDRFRFVHERIEIAMAGLRTQSDAGLYRQLASPILRGWLNEFGRIERWEPDESRLARLLKLWNNMLMNPYGSDFEAVYGTVGSWVMTWDPLIAMQVSSSGGDVMVRKTADALTLRTPDGNTQLGEMSVAVGPLSTMPANAPPLLPDTTVAVRNDLPLLRLKLDESGPPSRHSGIERGAIDDRRESYGSFDPEPFMQAASLLRDAWPEEYGDLVRTLQVVVPRDVPPGWTVGGFTIASHQGACWVVARGVIQILETLVHEHSHVKLRYLEEAHPILDGEQPERLFRVAWRSDPRPLVGLYEGVFVHLQVVAALERVAAMDATDSRDSRFCLDAAAETRAQVEEGLKILHANARFTEAGHDFLGWAAEQSGLDFFV